MGDGLGKVARRALLGLGWAVAASSPFVTHAALVTGRLRLVALGFAAVQVVMVAAFALHRATGWRRGVGVATAAVLLVALAARLAVPGTVELLAASGASHAIIYTSLLLLFASSLRPGRIPLVTQLASRMHPAMPLRRLIYTRKVTEAWCLFCIGQLAMSAALLLLAPAAVWSLFVNVLDAPCVVAMFAGEYAVRRMVFRGQPHASPLEAARQFRQMDDGPG